GLEDVSIWDPVPTKVTHHDYEFPDGDHVKVRDRVIAYCTKFPTGVDNDHDMQGDVGAVLEQEGASSSKAKILGAISDQEGSFDAVNTYDRKKDTWGFMQWAGGSKSDLTQALRKIKNKYPDAFARSFQAYGIDVEHDEITVTLPDGTGKLS